MRYLNKLLGICLTAFLLITVSPAPTQAQPGVSVSFQTFYDELQPYGTWVNDPDYGDVWVPDVDEDFKPYATNGHWIVTEYGNTWESDYEWGWAPFHYGRWRFDDYYGWEWIPGSEWGPAWVNWRTGGGYYAWAPLGPRVSIDISFGSGYNVPDDYWVCAPYAYITSPRIYDYYVPRARVVNIIRNTTIINNVYVNNNRRYVSGPRPQDIERYTNRRVDIYRVNNVNDPRNRGISNNTVNIYRPNISRGNNNGADRPRPERVVDAAAYRNAHPNEGLGNRNGNIGAVVNHNNASKLAQTARGNRADNGNVVRVNRPGGAPNGSFPTPSDNNGRNGGNRRQYNQPGQQNSGTPSNGTQVGATSGSIPANPGNNNNGRFNRDRSQPNQSGQPVNNGQPSPGNPAANPSYDPNGNNGRFNRNRGSQQNQGGQPTQTAPANGGQPVQNNQPVTTPNNGNGGFRGGRFNRPPQSAPATGNSPTVVQPQQATDQQMQQREQQRQQRMQQRQQQQQPGQQPAAEQQQQQREQQRQQMMQQRQQQNQQQQNQQAEQQRQQQAAQQAQQRQQQQAQQQQQQQAAQQQRQQQAQQQQQQRQQQQQQRQQQRPQAQPQQQQPQQARPERKEEHPPL